MPPSCLRFVRSLLALAVAVHLAGCSTTRPPAPPAGEVYSLPWGAVAIDQPDASAAGPLRELMATGMRHRLGNLAAEYPRGEIPYRMLALSGGGAWGAWGAGVLVGWTEAGARPAFDVVTGISTGALMSTFAFLGAEYDDDLFLYTRIDDDDIFRVTNPLAGPSVVTTKPLRKLLEDYIDDDVLAAVAEEYAHGRRLFIGTTNLDTGVFTIWDMGAIASSERPDRLERYRDVVLASASLPVLFPPVYLGVEDGSEEHWQMHVDGGVREMVFAYDFADELERVGAELGLVREDLAGEIYLLHNGTLYADTTYEPVRPQTLAVATKALMTMLRTNTLASLYYIYVEALIRGLDFHISFIPREYDLDLEMAEFDPVRMTALFESGRAEALAGAAWTTVSAPEAPEEMRQKLDPDALRALIEGRPSAPGATPAVD